MLSAELGTSVRLYPLRYLPEGDEVVVGRTDNDSYGLFPADGAELLQELAKGRSPAQAAAWYEQRHGEPVDIDEFIETLRELDFVLPDGDGAVDAAGPVRWQRLGRAAFSPVAVGCYVLLVAATIAICITDSRFVPVRGNVFFTHYLVVIEVCLFFLQVPFVLLHEWFHVLAGRRLGLRSSLRISRRMYFLTFETVLDGLVVVPRRQRYLPMLAGLLADLLSMCALTVTAWLMATPGESLSWPAGLCLALAFMTIPRIFVQFYFFLQTDIYHLVTTVLNCVDLHTTARQMLANRIWALRGRPERVVDGSRWHPRDVAVARWYAPMYAIGYAFLIVSLVLITVPVAWRFFSTAVRTVLNGSSSPAHFWDAALLLAMTALQLGLAGLIALRDRRRLRRRTM